MVTDHLPEPGLLKMLPMDNLKFEKNTVYTFTPMRSPRFREVN